MAGHFIFKKIDLSQVCVHVWCARTRTFFELGTLWAPEFRAGGTSRTDEFRRDGRNFFRLCACTVYPRARATASELDDRRRHEPSGAFRSERATNNINNSATGNRNHTFNPRKPCHDHRTPRVVLPFAAGLDAAPRPDVAARSHSSAKRCISWLFAPLPGLAPEGTRQ